MVIERGVEQSVGGELGCRCLADFEQLGRGEDGECVGRGVDDVRACSRQRAVICRVGMCS